MKQTKSSHRDHAKAIHSATDVRAGVVSTDQLEFRRSLVLLWLAIAWIAGTLVVEVAAIGAETDLLSPKAPLEMKFAAALDIDETNACLAMAPLDGLYRIESNEQLKPSINKIIETETLRLAQRESMKATQLASDDPKGDLETNVDPVTAPSSVAKAEFAFAGQSLAKALGIQQVNHADDLFAPIHVETSAIPVRPVTVPYRSDLVNSAQTFSIHQSDQRTSEAREEKLNSPTLLTIKPASKTTNQPNPELTNGNVLHARTVSLVHKSDDADVAGQETDPHATTPLPADEHDQLVASSRTDTENTLKPKQTRAENESQPVLEAELDPVATRPATNVAITTDAHDQATTAIDLPLDEPNQTPLLPASQPDERIAAAWPFAKPIVTKQNQSAVSLNVDNADVRTVFEMLARGYGMNILVSPDVTGVVNANVEGLTPQQTLQGVLKMCSLSAQVEEGVVYVYPDDKLPADARHLRLFPLDFARAETVEATVQGLLSPIGNAYTSMLDAKDNLKTREAVVVVDTPESIRRIESYIFQVDQPPRQVMIEARVLEVELNDTLEHGIDFSALFGKELVIGTTGLTSAAATGEAVFYAGISGDDVTTLIELLETTTDSKTLASPKIMVVNGQEAKIQVGQQLGFTVATVTQTSTIQDVQFLDTGVVLTVKPTISRDNKIMMEVKPEVSNGQINPETLLPEEETRELQTSVLLNDHQGMVIGGLIQETDRTVIKKLPWLGDVRHVGKFFQRRKATRSRSEIIIALVPHIIDVDSCPHRDCHQHEELEIEYQRTNTRILHGVLQRTCRPWEPRLPDTVGAEKHYDVNKINRMMP